MIDSNHIERIRIIQQDTNGGTQILSDLDKASEKDTEVDVLAPVRTSIGANFADSLFASSANVLVEGYTDKRYLEAFSHLFRQEKDGSVIDYRTNVIDVDGSKADYLAKILDAEGYTYVILLDNDDGAQTRKEGLIDRGINVENIHTLNQSLEEFGVDDKITIEDLFSAEFFGSQVIEIMDDVKRSHLNDILDDDTVGIIDSLEGRLSELEGRNEIDNRKLRKGAIADAIADKIISGDISRSDLDDETITNFQSLIVDINSSLEENQ